MKEKSLEYYDIDQLFSFVGVAYFTVTTSVPPLSDSTKYIVHG